MHHAHATIGVAVPVVPVISEAALGLLTLGAVLVFIVCWGLHEGWNHTIGYGLRWIANQIDDVSVDVGVYTIRPFGFVADVFRSVDHRISHALAVAALNTESAVVSLWHLTAEVFWWSVHETKALALDTFHAMQYQITVTIPDAAKWARREAVTVAHRLVHREAAIARAAEREIGHVAHVAQAEAIAAGREAEHALDWSEAKVGQLERYIDGLDARVSRLAKRLTPSAIVALIGATIFTEFGLGWLRCNNVGRTGKRLCGLGLDALDALLVGTLAVEGTISLQSMANELVDLSGEIVPAVTGFVRELNGVALRTAEEQGLA